MDHCVYDTNGRREVLVQEMCQFFHQYSLLSVSTTVVAASAFSNKHELMLASLTG